MSVPTEVAGVKASTNGELINRVQQLRLDNQLGKGTGGSRGSWLPWVLCGMMAVAWAGLGVRWYKAPEATTDTTPSNGSAKPANSQAGNQASVPAGALVVQIKGTL